MTRQSRIAFCVLLVSIAVTFNSVGAQITEPEHSPIITDDHIELVVAADHGRVEWQEVAASLAQSLALDVESVQRLLPQGGVNLRSAYIRLACRGVRIASRRKIIVEVIGDTDDRRALKIRVDRSLFGVKPTPPIEAATFDLDRDWQTRLGKPLVLCLHGITGQPEVWAPMRSYLREHGFATGAIGYDDDQSIADSAKEVEQLIRDHFVDDQRPALALVGHSMGGLVAREWTENPDLDGDHISHLITVASPHGGSHWASMPPLLDLVSEGRFDLRDMIDVISHQPSAPSLRDLDPESEFLSTLASRPRRPGVRYATLVGTGSPITREQADRLADRLRSLNERSRTLRWLRPRISPLIDGFDEVVRGSGDGVVAADRAVIEGIDDVVSFDLSHAEMIRPVHGQAEQPVWMVIRDRLE